MDKPAIQKWKTPIACSFFTNLKSRSLKSHRFIMRYFRTGKTSLPVHVRLNNKPLNWSTYEALERGCSLLLTNTSDKIHLF